MEPLERRKGVLIVGGGPAGVAAALSLAKLRNWTNITLVERTPDLVSVDPDRSYTYGVDGRSLRWAKALGLDEALMNAGFAATAFDVNVVHPDGKHVVVRRGIRPKGVTTYMMPRNAFMGVLVAELEAHNLKSSSPESKIRVLLNSKVTKLERVKDEANNDLRFAVHVVTAGAGASGEEEEGEQVFYPSLVLACDGINSVVRKTLEGWAAVCKEAKVAASTPLSHRPACSPPTFALLRFPSPSTGLRLKVLRLPPNPATKHGLVLRNHAFWRLSGVYQGSAMRMTLFPVRDEDAPRTGLGALRPDHPFWSLPVGDAGAVKECLRQSFPQMDFDTLVPEAVFQAYADSKGVTFPCPQASHGLAFVLGTSSAALLLGDAAHAFPPDLGQGVNAAMLDVLGLTQHLEAHDDDVAEAAEAYDTDRGPEAVALAKLCPLGFPYQYQQSFWMYRWWVAKMLGRKYLSKAVGGLVIAPPAMMMVQDVSLRYSEILERELNTRWRIKSTLLLLGSAAALLLARKAFSGR